jgi:fused signal recognition particle receptor
MLQIIAVLQSWVDELGIKLVVTDMHAYIFIGTLSVLFLISLTLIFKSTDEVEKEEALEAEQAEKEVVEEKTAATPVVETTEEKVEVIAEVEETVEVVEEKPKGPSWTDRLKKGLSRSRSEVWGKLGGIFTSGKIDDDALEEIEEILYGADIGPATASELLEALQEEVKKEGFGEDQFKSFLKDFLKSKMESVQEGVDSSLFKFEKAPEGQPKVIMIVGVNGAGKTTTIGKLATKLTNQGANVVVGACDTFRAAAVDQLQVWCDRAGAKMIRAKEGANPSGVGYDALKEAMGSNADYCILDTAGRLHTAGNLMEELTKSKNVLKKLMPDAPHQTLLVIDAITGQNAIRQAEEFNKALELSGLIFTKCDGSSKAGSAVAIVQKLQVPITYIGVGENVEDLNEFALDDYVDALIGN